MHEAEHRSGDRIDEPRIIDLRHAVAGAEVLQLEIFPYLGTSRLEEPLNRHPVDVVFHGHAHHGTPEGRTRTGTTVYNVAIPLLLQKCPDRPPFRVVELPQTPPSDTEAAMSNARQTAGSKRPPRIERPTGTSDRH